MRVVCDTSVLVEVDRGNEQVVQLLKRLMEAEDELIISIVTVAELLTGAYLRRDTHISVLNVKEVMNQFTWRDVDEEIAEMAAKMCAFLISEKREYDFADVLIGATLLCEHADTLITLNKKDFVVFPQLKDRVLTPEEFEGKQRKKR